MRVGCRVLKLVVCRVKARLVAVVARQIPPLPRRSLPPFQLHAVRHIRLCLRIARAPAIAEYAAATAAAAAAAAVLNVLPQRFCFRRPSTDAELSYF